MKLIYFTQNVSSTLAGVLSKMNTIGFIVNTTLQEYTKEEKKAFDK